MAAKPEPVLVPLREVEKELSRQLKQLQGEEHAPVQRVHMSNLIIYCEGNTRAQALEADLPDIMREHPARVLLLIGEPASSGDEMMARVLVRPLETDPKHHGCVEQVTVHAITSTKDHLPFAARTLLIGDLPTNLWWAAPEPPPMAGTLLYELGEHAQQIIYDSSGWTDPARGIAATASWLEQVERFDQGPRWRVASDLNWRRLKIWRRSLMQALDPASAPGADETVTEIYVEYGPGGVVRAWLLASWLVCRLGWRIQDGKIKPGTEVTWRCQDGPESARVRLRQLDGAAPEVHRVRLACRLQDKDAALVLTIQDKRRMAIAVEGIDTEPRTNTLPAHTAAEIVGRQLSDRERDSIFRESMATAQIMARSVLH